MSKVSKYGVFSPYFSIFSPNVGKYGPEKTPYFYLDNFTQCAHYADDSEKYVTVWAKHLCASERSYWVLSRNYMVNRLLSYCSWDIEGRNVKEMVANGSSEPKNPYHFLKELNVIFQMHLNILPKPLLDFYCHQ